MGTCMGVVPVILIPNQHITILQFVFLTEQQIAEELHEERLVWLYSFLRITVIGTYQCAAEVPRVISKYCCPLNMKSQFEPIVVQ